MNQIREFGSMLCVAAVGCCAMKMLLPENTLEPMIKTVLSIFFILCLLLPLRGMPLPQVDLELLEEETASHSEKLQDIFSRQLEASVEENLRQVIKARLKKLGVEGTKLEINVNTDEEGRIDIKGVELFLPQEYQSSAQEIARTLQEELELPVTAANVAEDESDGD